MSVKLIAIDVDETLVTDKQELQAETIKAIKKANDQGVRIVITTGRPPRSALPVINKLGLAGKTDEYMINYHGTLIKDTANNLIKEVLLTPDQIRHAAELAKNYDGVDFVVETENEMFLTKPDITWASGFESNKNHYQMHVQKIEQILDPHQKHHFFKMMFIGPKEKLDEVQSDLPRWVTDDLTTIRTEDEFIDMFNKHVNKGWALQALSEKLGIKPENIMAIGDGTSDIPMIKYAKYGVAMGNGNQNVKDAAAYVTSNNNHNGVAQAIEHYVLK